ncbi:DUF1697 domain-containing protein [Faecalispora anaeroviscerum]|uniref:DUF1697 domain-containing protein n=1 Tax=Faecalispora anaeroviscerum TaxID=2991836 RepID=UPI0024B9A0A4|nr:DUF1697 domain-containing protein [Faecalispora anaeroviscerum]
MQFIALLRGVTPTGKNRIPSMAYLAKILTDAGFHDVRTYIQSGNILFDTDLSREEAAAKIHDVILNQIGADLSVILKMREQLAVAAAENPFGEGYDISRIHLTFTNDSVDAAKVKTIEETDFGYEKFIRGSECFYLYLPQGVARRVLYSGYLEKRLGITTTTRKLSVVTRLCELAE